MAAPSVFLGILRFETMKNTRLIIRLIGLGEARAEGLAAAILLTALAVLAMALVAYTKA
jgi:hypothetical protein